MVNKINLMCSLHSINQSQLNLAQKFQLRLQSRIDNLSFSIYYFLRIIGNEITPIFQIITPNKYSILFINMHSFSSPDIFKHHSIRKFNRTQLNVKRCTKKTHVMNTNFLQILRKIAHPTHPNPTNKMISFLNLKKQPQVSLHYIPSIQNMLSEQNIQGQDNGASKSSIERGFDDDLISQTNNQMRVLYVCMLEKIMKQLQTNTSDSQRRKIIRGVWNILIKYCKDMNFQIFANIGTKIQWGLLQLINFDFSFSRKERFYAEQLLLDNKEIQSDTSVQLF